MVVLIAICALVHNIFYTSAYLMLWSRRQSRTNLSLLAAISATNQKQHATVCVIDLGHDQQEHLMLQSQEVQTTNGQTRRRLHARQKLIVAADELFREMDASEEEAYAATTIDMIVARAGVSRRTFFNHFSGKADVLLLDLQTAINDHLIAFDDRSKTEHPLVSAIRASEKIMQSFLADPINARRAQRQTNLGHLKPNQWSLIGEWEMLLTDRIAERIKGKNAHRRARVIAGSALATIRGTLVIHGNNDSSLDGSSVASTRELAKLFREMASSLEDAKKS